MLKQPVGLAFTTTDRGKEPDLSRIEVLQDWTAEMSNLDKVPSVKSYSVAEDGEPQWGSHVSKNAVTMVNQKLELELQSSKLDELDLTLYVLNGAGNLSFNHIRQVGPNPEFTTKSPEEIVQDYLTHIFQCATKVINVSNLETTNTALDLVVTVPVVSVVCRKSPSTPFNFRPVLVVPSI